MPGAFPTLGALNISANNLSGSLPPEWGANGTGLFRLRKLDVQQNGLQGYLPDAWGPGFQVGPPLHYEAIIMAGRGSAAACSSLCHTCCAQGCSSLPPCVSTWKTANAGVSVLSGQRITSFLNLMSDFRCVVGPQLIMRVGDARRT